MKRTRNLLGGASGLRKIEVATQKDDGSHPSPMRWSAEGQIARVDPPGIINKGCRLSTDRLQSKITKTTSREQSMHMTKRISLIFGMYFLLHALAVSGQIVTDTPAIGVWMGAIKMGNTHPRLVFSIVTDSAGQLTGTVGSPDKGVKGIPLSRVYVSGTSIVIDVSAAGASFKGVISGDKRTINGTWKEGEASYSLILERVTNIAEYRRPDNDNASPLKFQLASQHFDFYSNGGDREVLDDLATTLEANYSRITDNMKTQFTEKIKVYIYPTLKSFHDAVFLPDAPDWVVGAAGRNELKMISPRSSGTAHTYSSLMQAIVHELTHTVVLNVREQGHVGLPKWLNEGYAFYEASQMTDNMRKVVKENSARGSLPSWNQLDQAGTVQFGDMNGYAYSTTIIEFLIHSYGLDKLRALRRNLTNSPIGGGLRVRPFRRRRRFARYGEIVTDGVPE